MCCYFHLPPPMLTLKSACTVAWKALHGVRVGLWGQSETFARTLRFQIWQDFIKMGAAHGLRDPEWKGVKAVTEVGLLDPISQKHGSTAWFCLLHFVTSMRVVPGVANANRLYLEPQGLRLGEHIDDKLFSSVWTSASQTSNPFKATADCPLDIWRTRQRSGEALATLCVVNSLIFAPCWEQGTCISEEHLR